MLTFQNVIILYALKKKKINDHFEVGWKALNSLLLPGSMV